MLLKMAYKNIWRKVSRTVLTISAVVVCTAGVMVFAVFMEGTVDLMLDGVVDQFGHARLIHEKVLKKKRLYGGSYFVNDAKRLIADLKKVPGVVAVAPRVELGAYIDHKGIQAPAAGLGLDTIAEKTAMKLHTKLREGRMMKPTGREVVIGWRLAKRLKAKRGDFIVLIGKTVEDSVSALKAKVVGISATGVGHIDKMFFLSLSSAQYFLDIPNQASTILVFAKNLRAADRIAKELPKVKRPKAIRVQNWRNSSYFGRMLPIINVYYIIFGGLIVFIAGVGLMNTMTMSVIERKGEVGVMMALGFRSRDVGAVFLFEGLFLGIIGASIGLLLGGLLSYPLIAWGYTMNAEVMADLPYPMQNTIKGQLTLTIVLLSFFVGVLSTIVGTLLPALQASRLEPVEALRVE